MCTAATYKTKDFYFGRTLDYEFSYGNEITITPRNYEIKFQWTRANKKPLCNNRNGICIRELPLYYDAINEKRLRDSRIKLCRKRKIQQKSTRKNQHSTIWIHTMDIKPKCNSRRSQKTNRKHKYHRHTI